MDSTVVKVEKLSRLKRIAEMASFHLVESDKYISLARAVEALMITPSVENHAAVNAVLSLCKQHFSDYDNLRTVLVGELEMNGNLSRVDNSPAPTQINDDEAIIPDVETEEVESVTDGNITYVDFSKKR